MQIFLKTCVGAERLKDVAFAALLMLTQSSLPMLLGIEVLPSRPIFNIDYVIPVLISIWSAALAVFVYAVLLLVDAFAALSYHYNFNLADAVFNLTYFYHVDVAAFVDWRLALLIPILLFINHLLYSTIKAIGSGTPFVIKLITFIVLLLSLDHLNGSFGPFRSEIRGNSINISGSSLVNVALAASLRSGKPSDSLYSISDGESLMTQSKAINWVTKKQNKIVLIIVESMGYSNSENVRAYLSASLYDHALANSYSLEKYIVPFRGSTTYAELRELCGLRGSFRNLKENNLCVPRLLKNNSVKTIGIHGFSGKMFSRDTWWPLIGLDEVFFQETLPNWGRDCGSGFRGRCDEDIIKFVFQKSSSTPNSFVYGLTLNGHIPVLAQPVTESLLEICKKEGMSDTDCLLNQIHGTVLSAIKRELNSYKSALPLVLIVGDHSPPYLSAKDKSLYLNGMVQGYLLRPKE